MRKMENWREPGEKTLRAKNRKSKRNPHVTPGPRNLTQATLALSSLR